MTKAELLDKIKRAEKNPLIDASLKASLLKKYNAQLAELEKSDEKKGVEKAVENLKEKVASTFKTSSKGKNKFKIPKDEKKETKSDKKAKYEKGDVLAFYKDDGAYKKLKVKSVRFDDEFEEFQYHMTDEFGTDYNILERHIVKKMDVGSNYDCDDLIAKEKERVKKSKDAAKKRAAEPEKTEVTKAKEKIERTHETIEKKIEKGEFTKAQIAKLIGETKDLLKMLEKALKSL